MRSATCRRSGCWVTSAVTSTCMLRFCSCRESCSPPAWFGSAASNIWRLTRPRLKQSHPNDKHQVQTKPQARFTFLRLRTVPPKTCYSCSGVALGEALGSVVVPSSVAWRRAFLVEGLPVVSSLDSPVRSSVALSVCRRDDGVAVALLLPDGDSPRVAEGDSPRVAL